jgi:hypothetical protein
MKNGAERSLLISSVSDVLEAHGEEESQVLLASFRTCSCREAPQQPATPPLNSLFDGDEADNYHVDWLCTSEMDRQSTRHIDICKGSEKGVERGTYLQSTNCSAQLASYRIRINAIHGCEER